MSALAFAKATKKQAKLRLALEGPAGYGKTYTALGIATTLSPQVAFVDTEAGSASKYADHFTFDVVEFNPPFHPDRATEAITMAAGAGYGAIVIDSLSHFWAGDGGILDIVDEIAKTRYRGDSHRAWKEGGEIQQRLIDAILRTDIHVIACMRTKKDYVREEVEEDGRRKTRIRAAGTKTVQRDEFDYEFDLVGRFETPTVLTIIKSRLAELPPDTVLNKPGKGFAEKLAVWLDAGDPPPPPPPGATEEQLAELSTLADTLVAAGVFTDAQYATAVRKEYHTTPSGLTAEQARELIGRLVAKLETLNQEPAPSEFKVPDSVPVTS